MHEDFDYWIVKGIFTGDVYIPEEIGNLPVEEGTVNLTKYCRLIQRFYGIERERPNFEVKIKTRKDADAVHNAFDFCEELLTEIVFALDVPVNLVSISMSKVSPKQGEEEDYVLADYKYDENEKWEPYMYFQKGGNLVSYGGGIRIARALRGGNIEKIQKRFAFLKNASSLILEAVDFYKRGMKMVSYWDNEAFLCFYKVIELFKDAEYKKKYEEHVKKKIADDFSLLIKKCRPNITGQDIEQNLKDFLDWGKGLTNKELFRFICESTKFYERYKGTTEYEKTKEISRNLTDIRAGVAHPHPKEVTKDELKVCRDLAKHLIDVHVS